MSERPRPLAGQFGEPHVPAQSETPHHQRDELLQLRLVARFQAQLYQECLREDQPPLTPERFDALRAEFQRQVPQARLDNLDWMYRIALDRLYGQMRQVESLPPDRDLYEPYFGSSLRVAQRIVDIVYDRLPPELQATHPHPSFLSDPAGPQTPDPQFREPER